MGATSEMHLQMRADEIVQMYDSTFTKKEAIKTGTDLALNVFESGEVSPAEVLANLSRLKWVVDAAETTIRSKLEIYDKQIILGLEFNYVNGGNTINYAEDEIYSAIKADLDARTEQLKMAQKQDTFDAYGNQVPKVSTTPRKSSITIKEIK
jgi:phosphoglycerate dehydrogenase-like enzyme